MESDSNVASAFGDALGGILSVVAQNVVLTISVPAEARALGAKLVDVHHDNKEKQSDGSFKVSLGDFYSEESRDVLCEVVLAKPPSELGSLDDFVVSHVSVSMSFLDTIHKTLSKAGPALCSISRPKGSEVSAPNKHVVVQWLRVQASQAMKEADALAKVGNLADARGKINNMLGQLKEAKRSDELIAQIVSDLNGVLAGLATHSTYENFGAGVVAQKYQSHTMQRCTESSHVSGSTYRSKRKATKASFFQTSLGE